MSSSSPSKTLYAVYKYTPTYTYNVYYYDRKYSTSTPRYTATKTTQQDTWTFDAYNLTRTGYIFKGWYRSYSGDSGTGTLVQSPEEGLTLPYEGARSIMVYAGWEEIPKYDYYLHYWG